MANTVTIKRSNVANKQPTAADLAVGELAVNFPDRRIYTKNPANAIVPITGDAWDGDITDIDLDGGADVGANLADADLILVDSGGAGTNRKSAVSRIWTYISTKIAALADISAWAAVLDEDGMVSNSDQKVPTQQSVKAYVDNNTSNRQNIRAWAAVLDEDAMASNSDQKVPTQQSVKAYVDNNTSKLQNISSWAAVLDEDGMASNSNQKVPTQQSVKAYVDSKTARPTWTVLTGTLSVPLDGNYYEYQIPAGSTEGLSYSLPANNAVRFQYDAVLKITAPAAGTEVIAIPKTYRKLGPLDEISLTAGDEPIFVVLFTDNDRNGAPTINFTAQQGELLP